jgi:hypothetical protein
MKIYTLLTALILLGLTSYAQKANNVLPQVSEQAYGYQKTHKTLKTIGWVSLGTGVPLFCLGAALEIGSHDNQNGADAEKTGKWMVPTGAVLALASIPCFIVAHHYKSKAVSLSVISQPVYSTEQRSFASNIQPALRLKIAF